jgi:hypothetical protein
MQPHDWGLGFSRSGGAISRRSSAKGTTGRAALGPTRPAITGPPPPAASAGGA